MVATVASPTPLVIVIDIIGEVPIIITGSTMKSSPINMLHINGLTTLGIGRRHYQLFNNNYSFRNL